MGNSLFQLIYVAYKSPHQPLLEFCIDFWYKHTSPGAAGLSRVLLCSQCLNLLLDVTCCPIHLQGLYIAHIHSDSFKNYFGVLTGPVSDPGNTEVSKEAIAPVFMNFITKGINYDQISICLSVTIQL